MATPTQNQTRPAPRTNDVKPGEVKPGQETKTDIKPANGTTPVTGVVAVEGKEDDKEEQEAKARGVVPHMPICVIWKDPTQPPNKQFVAALLHPRDERVYKVQGRGLGGTRGTLEDEGYPTGPVRVDGPKWVEKRIPEGVQVLGYATLLGFPLPLPQD